LGGTFFSFVSSVSEPVFQCITAESQFAAGKFIQHPVASIEIEPATSIEADARSGAEGSRGPGDLGFEPTGAKRRTQVQILSHRNLLLQLLRYPLNHRLIDKAND